MTFLSCAALDNEQYWSILDVEAALSSGVLSASVHPTMRILHELKTMPYLQSKPNNIKVSYHVHTEPKHTCNGRIEYYKQEHWSMMIVHTSTISLRSSNIGPERQVRSKAMTDNSDNYASQHPWYPDL